MPCLDALIRRQRSYQNASG